MKLNENVYVIFFFKQKTAYEMRISDWSSDVCSSDLLRSGTSPMMLRKFPLALLATTILAGCNMAPEYHRPAMPAPAELPSVSTEPQQGTIEPADLAWRDFFTDERLRRLIALEIGRAHV